MLIKLYSVKTKSFHLPDTNEISLHGQNEKKDEKHTRIIPMLI